MEMEDIRATMIIIPMVSELIEAFPAPPRPDNDLMAIIRQLSSHNAAMLCMGYYGSLSVREMAGVLGISQTATYKKLNRAVANLRKIIAERYPTLKSTKEAKAANLLSPYK
jgi:DNA-directed RNA polymerase specialized sigma24 family protein